MKEGEVMESAAEKRIRHIAASVHSQVFENFWANPEFSAETAVALAVVIRKITDHMKESGSEKGDLRELDRSLADALFAGRNGY